jgi:thymidylate synthase (FAD)
MHSCKERIVSTVKLVWATPDLDIHLAYIARVSNPDNQNNPKKEGLFKFMMREGHVSPFEMCNMCVEITTTRDIARQVLRHRSFSFQEFSQRYADTSVLPPAEMRECRMQDTKDRQNSIVVSDALLESEWARLQDEVDSISLLNYTRALSIGIAKEQARALLPEGLTTSRMYMNGNMRSWIHYLNSRLHSSTQKEHRIVAQQVLDIMRQSAPLTTDVFFPKEVS